MKCVRSRKENNKDEYPKVIYGYAILLDNKIENWSVRTTNRKYLWEFKNHCKIGRLQDYKIQKVCWVCNNAEEGVKVFDELAPKW